MKICQEAPNFVTIEQKYLALHTKAAVCFTVVGDIICHKSTSVQCL